MYQLKTGVKLITKLIIMATGRTSLSVLFCSDKIKRDKHIPTYKLKYYKKGFYVISK